MKKKGIFFISFVLILSLVLVAGCSQPEPAGESQAETIKIGTVGPLSGDYATYGRSVKQGVEIAIEEINEAGGINGQQLELIPEDTEGKQEGAASAVQKLVDQDKVVAIVGAVLSGETMTGAPFADEAEVPIISPSSTAPGIPDIGPYVFRNVISDDVQSAQMAAYAVEELGLKRLAVLYTNNDYGVALKEGFVAKAEDLGAEVVAVESFLDGDENFNAQITKIAQQNPEALYIGGYYTEAAKIAQQAARQGLDVQLLGADGFYSSKLTELGGDAVEGALFTASFFSGDPSEEVQKFVKAYQEKFGETPDMFAANAYDTMKIIAQAIEEAGTDGPALRDAIHATKDYPGITGSTSFTENGDVVKEIVVIKVENGQFTRVR